MVNANGLDWEDVLIAFGTVLVCLAVVGCGFYAYNSVMGTLWETKKSLKDSGVEKREDGTWVIKTNSNLDHEAYQDKTQRGFMKVMGASSVSNTPPILGKKSKDKKGAKNE